MSLFVQILSPSPGWRIAYICLALRLLDIVGPGLAGTALFRLFESDVCRSYYRRIDASVIPMDDMVPEMKCKVDSVQSEISNLTGMGSLISVLPTILGALPYLIWGRILDKKLMLTIYFIASLALFYCNIAILYYYNTLNIKLIWLTTMINLVGGGRVVFRGVISSMAAEALPKASLTPYYLYSSAILLIAGFLSSAAGLKLMDANLWGAVMLGAGVMTLSIPVLTFLDHHPTVTKDKFRAHQPQRSHNLSAWSEIASFRRHGELLVATVRQHYFYMLIFLLHQAGSSFRQLEPIWMSKRYDRTLQEIGYYQMSEKLLIAIILPLIPRLHSYLTRRNDWDEAKDEITLRMIKWSVMASIVGATALSLSWTIFPAMISLVITALGSGFYDMLLGFITSKSTKADLVQVYLCISIIEELAGDFGGTIIHAFYSLTVRMDGLVGMALPLWMCAGFFIGTLLLLRRI